MSIEEKCIDSSPSDKEFFEQSLAYLTNVFFDAYPQTSVDTICKLAQTHLNLFKTIYNTLNERYEDNSEVKSDESNIESPKIKHQEITHFQSPERENIQNISKNEAKQRPSNPKRSPSKFSKDSYEYKQFVNYYSQKLRDRNIDPKERSIKVNEKWNSMNTEKVLNYLKKHKKDEY